MIPSLEVSHSAAGGVAVNVPPPRFRPLSSVSGVSISYRDYTRGHGRTAAQENGLRYESYVQDFLKTKFDAYEAEPVIRLLDDRVQRELRPDGILKYKHRAYIFEIKYGHCSEAWWQLEKLYKEALAKLYHCPLSLVEICRTYDPSAPFPVPVVLVNDLEDWVSRPRDAFGVYVWRKTTS